MHWEFLAERDACKSNPFDERKRSRIRGLLLLITPHTAANEWSLFAESFYVLYDTIKNCGGGRRLKLWKAKAFIGKYNDSFSGLIIPGFYKSLKKTPQFQKWLLNSNNW